MKFKNLTAISSLIICLSLVSCKDKGKPTTDDAVTTTGTPTYSDSASSSVKVFDQNGRVCIQQSNTYYQLADVYEGTTKIPLLLKIKKTELCFADSINKDKVYEIDAKSILDSKNVQWQSQFVATDIEFKDNTLLAIHEGTDTEEDLLTRFSMLDGKEIFSCSYGELKAVVPNVREKRFIGYTSQKAATEPIQNTKEENLLGIVRYSTGTKSVNALKITLKRSGVAAKIPLYTPDMVLVPATEGVTAIEEGKSIIMMKADEHYTSKDVGGFALTLTYYYGDDNESTIISVPVVNDQFDLAHAKFDKDIFDITPQ